MGSGDAHRAAQRAAEQVLQALGESLASDAVSVIEKILAEPSRLRLLINAAGSLLEAPSEVAEDVDRQVEVALESRYGGPLRDVFQAMGVEFEQRLLTKRDRIGIQNKRVLGLLLQRLGDPVPLFELLLVNEMSSETSRRVRELRHEHGSFDIEVRGSGRETSYVLISPEPNIDRCADFVLKENLRSSTLRTPERLLALLGSRMPAPVHLDELLHVNPVRTSSLSGRARAAQSETGRRMRALREDGWRVYSGNDSVVAGLRPNQYVLTTLDRVEPYERLKHAVWSAAMQAASGRCQTCGWSPLDGPSQGRKLLEVHHLDPQALRKPGVHDLWNLVVLCNVDHDARHS